MNLASAVQTLEIVGVDLLLSGDNALVVALACRDLPARRRAWGLALGAAAAIGLRILFTGVVGALLAAPFLKIVGGALLIGVAARLVVGDEDAPTVKASKSLWRAVRRVALADAIMSLDNVVAVAAAAQGSLALIVFGLAFSIPLIACGAFVLAPLLRRAPALAWAGAALMGGIAGQMIAADPGWRILAGGPVLNERLAATLGAGVVCAAAFALRRARFWNDG